MQHWYPINTLNVDGVPVFYRTGSGIVQGILKISRKGFYDYRVRDPNTRNKYFSLPDFAKPWCWRPQSERDWPAILPEPITEQPAAKPTTLAADGQTGLDGVDEVLNPKYRLGPFGQCPETRAEAESRYLRALLTDRYMEFTIPDDMPGRSISGDWLRELVIGAKVIEKKLMTSRNGTLDSLQPLDYLDFHIDRSELESRAPRWEPDRRDIGDWDGGVLRWGSTLSPIENRIVRLRCARWSFRGIATRTPLSYEAVRRRYERAIDKVWRASRK